MSIFKNETTLPILITIACTLLMAGMLLYGYNTGKFTWLDNKTQKHNLVQVEKEEERIKRTDYTDVARKTLDWIDKERNQSGWYILGKNCGPNDCEQMVDDYEVGNKDGLIATWARLNYYEQHQDPKDLDIVKKDIDLFYDKYKNKDLNDSLWLCKITYEMAQSKYLEQVQKDKLKELCLKKEVLEIEKIGSYLEDKYEAFALKPSMGSWNYYTINDRYLDDVFGGVSDLVFKYKWTGDKNYLVQIDKYIENQSNLVVKNRGFLFDNIQNNCLLGLSLMDRYELAGKNKIDLDGARNWFEKLKIDEKPNLVNSPVCGLLAKKLYEVTGVVGFFNDLEAISKALTLNNQREERGLNQEGFVRSDLSKGGFLPNRVVVENGLMVELLR